ncbi:hypothetical protein Tco_0878483 [Tanacetum coccineum]|uniref:Uncharacterized protein n=1 Tax=Tanacetum coccineum TaxID=301880 RepID=A0ABQ5C0F8_9ASTR
MQKKNILLKDDGRFEDFRRSPLKKRVYNDLHKNDDEVDELDDDDVNDDDQDDVNDDDKETDSERTEYDKDKIPDPNEELTEHEKEEYSDQRVHTPPDYQLTEEELINEEGNIDDEGKMNEEEDDEVSKVLYDDLDINLGTEDAEMKNADQGVSGQQNVSQGSGFEKVEEDANVTLTAVHDTKNTAGTEHSSSVSSDFTSKLLNLDNTPPYLDESSSQTSSLFTIPITTVLAITSATTIPPPPPFFNHLQHEATPTPSPTTSKATTSTPVLPDFAFVFRFNERVTNLEKDLPEMKQVDRYAQALSSIPAIVDRYMDNKLREAINKAIQAHNLDFSDVATPAIQKNVAEFLEAVVLKKSSSQPQSSYEAATTLIEFKLIKILINKMEKNKSFNKDDHKRELYKALVTAYETDKDLFESYGEVFSLKRSRDDRDKDKDPSAGLD